jgi:hypothetical protein
MERGYPTTKLLSSGNSDLEHVLLALTCLILLVSGSFAAPGGHLVDAISDECETANAIWSPGLRGVPEVLAVDGGVLSIRSIDNGDDPYPSAEDMISTHADVIGRELTAAEGPSIVAWIWLPPFEQWPTGVNASGLREWFGVRVTARDLNLPERDGLYFPGIYVGTDDEGPCLIARVGDGYAPDVTIARVSATGWWSCGLAWNSAGVTEYYAAPDRVSLTSSDLLHVTPHFPDPVANRSLDILAGNFIALRMMYPPTGELSPDWRMDNFRVYVQTPPAAPSITAHLLEGQVTVKIAGDSRGFRYLLQRSDDLMGWTTVADYLSEGSERTYSESALDRAFFQVSRP